MSDVKRYQIGGRDIPASAAVFLPSEVVSSADYDALAAAHEQAWKSATSESHAWAREHEARMAVVAERDQLRAEVERLTKLAEAISADCNTVACERNDLRAELEAIRGQQAVAWVSPDAAGGVRWSPGALQQLSDGSPLYAFPPQKPDAVSVPRELLRRLLDSNNRNTFCAGTYLKAHDELSALLSTKNAEEGE